jgi:hypothetical protein
MSAINQTNSKAEEVKKPMTVLKKKVRKYFYIALTFFVLIIGAFIYWGYFFTFSDGYRAGLLQKFSRKGNIFKTYEGEMILSSVQSNKNVALASEKFVFSVSHQDVALQLEQMQGKSVIVHYTQKNNTLPWRGDTPFIVDSVKLSD